MTSRPGRVPGWPTIVGGLWAALPAVDLAIVVLAVLLGGPLLALTAAAACLAVILSIRFPGVLFAAYLLLAFYKGGVQPFSPIDLTFVLGGLNAAQIIPVLLNRRVRPVSTAGIALWIGLSLLIVTGVWYAPDQGLAADRALRWSTLVFLPILGGGLRVGSDPRELRHFLWSFFGMGVLTVALGLTQLSGTERLTVLNTNTIQVSRAALVVPILGVAFVLREGWALAKLALLVLIPAALIVAVASGSRGPLLFFVLIGAVGVGRYLLRPGSLSWSRVAVGGTAILATVVALVAFGGALPSTALDRYNLLGTFIESGLSGDLSTSVGDTSAGNRIVLFEAAATMFADAPLLGVGTSGFEALAPRYMSPDELEAWPHNALLQAAAEFGVVGLGIVVALLVLVFTRRLPAGSGGSALRIVFLFFLLNAMVSGDIFSDRETWGLLMLVLMIDAPVAIRTGRSLAMAQATESETMRHARTVPSGSPA